MQRTVIFAKNTGGGAEVCGLMLTLSDAERQGLVFNEVQAHQETYHHENGTAPFVRNFAKLFSEFC